MSTVRDDKRAPWFTAMRERPTAFHALRANPVFSYTLHTPQGYFDDPSGYELIVAVHGSGRGASDYRAAFADFADTHRCAVLCPLFPMGVKGDGYADGYKNLVEGDIRYDQILLSMVGDFEEASNREFPKFHLFGFSGGGQFVHRFFYACPERLRTVSIGSPGAMTRIDAQHDWWFGTRNFQAIFGRPLDFEQMRRVKVHMVAGDQDLEVLKLPPWLERAVQRLGPIGKNRVERLKQLKDNFEQNGIDVQIDFVPGVAHEGLKVIPIVQQFLLQNLR
jgi:hypothetical protein